MAKCSLVLLSMMVLLACSTVPARINGRSISTTVDENMTTTTTTWGSGAAGAALNSYGGCSQNPDPSNPSYLFCCDKDHECWPSLQECMPNCPCKINC